MQPDDRVTQKKEGASNRALNAERLRSDYGFFFVLAAFVSGFFIAAAAASAFFMESAFIDESVIAGAIGAIAAVVSAALGVSVFAHAPTASTTAANRAKRFIDISSE